MKKSMKNNKKKNLFKNMLKGLKGHKYSSPYLVEFKVPANIYTTILRRFNSKVVIVMNTYP